MLDVNIKRCSKCKSDKESIEFNKETRAKDGLSRWCRSCCGEWRRANVDRLVETNRKCRLRKLPQYQQRERGNNLKKYGMFLADYDNLLLLQGNKCAICHIESPGGKKNRFHVDHSHSTLNIRGLLCHHCNKELGQLKDSVEVLLNAVAYLKTAKTSFYMKKGKK